MKPTYYRHKTTQKLYRVISKSSNSFELQLCFENGTPDGQSDIFSTTYVQQEMEPVHE
jgi:hypothetical protein